MTTSTNSDPDEDSNYSEASTTKENDDDQTSNSWNQDDVAQDNEVDEIDESLHQPMIHIGKVLNKILTKIRSLSKKVLFLRF